MRKKIILFIIIVLLLSFSPLITAEAVQLRNVKVKIGLYYGTESLDSANLQNVTGYGSGYNVGYIDSAYNFNSLGYLPNVYLTISSDFTYHAQVNMYFSSFSEAVSYAGMLGDAFPAYENGSFVVRIGNFNTYSDAQNYAYAYGYTPVDAGAAAYTVKDTETGKIIFEYDMPGGKLGIEPVNNSFIGNEGAVTWFKSRKYYGAFEYSRSGTGISVSNLVNIEDYIRGVIPYEMSGAWPLEALKAQAVCARTYAFANLSKHSGISFDLCNTTDCQVYRGTGSATELSDRAVSETRGVFATYSGEPIDAVYYATNGGASENSENVWNKALPYLRAVRDDFEKMTNVSHSSWNYEITLSTITSILRERGCEINGSIVHAYAEYTNAGNIAKLTFIDSSGKNFTYKNEQCRSLFNVAGYNITVYSQRFIFEDKNAMRIQSNDEITNINSGSVSSGGGIVSSSIIAGSNIQSGFGLIPGTFKYGNSAPVISKSGTDYTDSIVTISGKSDFIIGGSGTQVTNNTAASSLTIPSSSSGTFVIRGSGNGHNVGLSQYGAKAMAEKGYTYEQILTYYYTGISIVTAY